MVSSPRRARRTTSSYACQNWRKSIDSTALTLGTTRLRDPSGLARSMAMPRLTCSGSTSTGLPSAWAKELFISGCSARALTRAYPMRWVKLTLPPRPRNWWLLITMRLSESRLAGTARTLVAVGTVSDSSMLATIRAAMPRRTVVFAPVGSARAATSLAGVAGGASLGLGGAATGPPLGGVVPVGAAGTVTGAAAGGAGAGEAGGAVGAVSVAGR